MSKERFRFYKDYPKTCRPDDFWGQVKRTVNGVPVSQKQIDFIVDAVVKGLSLAKDDILLDLCCGNGALSTLLFNHCRRGTGVDFSEYLISIAQMNFADEPRETYVLSDVVDYCETSLVANTFTKALSYGSFAYLEPGRAERILSVLYNNFPALERVFIGNCPDKELLSEFVRNRKVKPGFERDPDSPIGLWRTREEFASLAHRCEWTVSFSKMPAQFYASHYRYDVVLSRDD